MWVESEELAAVLEMLSPSPWHILSEENRTLLVLFQTYCYKLKLSIEGQNLGSQTWPFTLAKCTNTGLV